MDKSSADQQKLPWDIGFLIKGVPKTYRIGSDNLRMATIAGDGQTMLDNVADKVQALAEFKRSKPESETQLVAVRVVAESEKDAVADAWRLLGHVMDTMTLVLDDAPSVAPVLFLRKGKDRSCAIRRFKARAWMTLQSPDPTVVKGWENHRILVLERLMPFLGRVLDQQWESHTLLEHQLMYSLRLYRLGCDSQSYGVEYLCKFAAMEGLVLGGEKNDKRRNLVERLSGLMSFVTWDIEKSVNELWEKRNLVTHEARSEYFPTDDRSYPFQVLMPELEQITEAVCVFAADNIKQAKTVGELWALREQYQMPDLIKQYRPNELRRLGCIDLLVKVGEISNIGQWFDPVFEAKLTPAQ